MKRELADNVSTSAIDEIYAAAREAGPSAASCWAPAAAASCCSSPSPTATAVRAALKGLVEFACPMGSPGSRVVVYEPNGLSAG